MRFNVHWNRRSFLCARLFHIRKLNVLLFICSTGTFCKCQNHTKHINSDSFVDEMRKCVWLHLCAQMWKINGNQQMRKSTERQRENRKFPLEEKNALEIYMWQSISGNVLFFDEFWFCCTSCNSVLTDWTRNKYPTIQQKKYLCIWNAFMKSSLKQAMVSFLCNFSITPSFRQSIFNTLSLSIDKPSWL